MKYQILLFAVCVILSANRATGQQMARGSFLFGLDYLDSTKSHASSPMALPDHIQSTLQNDEVRTDIVSDYVSASSFTNFKTRRFKDYITVRDKKVLITGSLDSLIGNATNRSRYTLRYEPGEKNILGLPCKKAVAHFNDSQIPDATIYYCPQIAWLPNPVNMQYAGVHGLIVDLVSQFQGVSIHLKLEKMLPEIPQTIFDEPQGYEHFTESEALIKLAAP